MKHVGITGASGFVGSAVVAALLERGDAVHAFVRDPDGVKLPPGVLVQRLDLSRADDVARAAQAFEGLDAVIHLAGETVAGRWTQAKKAKIHDSRQVTTRNLVAAMRSCARPPRVLACASASGYYGSRGDEPLDESAPPGTDFLARVCIDWEQEAGRASEFGSRVVCLRQGLVLGRGGGALAAMLPPFAFFVGGPLGSGAQWWPWIHLADDVKLFLFAIDDERTSGPVNAVSPDLANNVRFSQALGHALRRPALAYAPGVALRAVLGEFADTLLASQLMLPAKAHDLGFCWDHESLDQVLLDLLDPGSRRAPGTTRFEATETVAGTLENVFSFFANAANLEALTPPALRMHILTLPTQMQRGAIIEYALRVHGVPVRWKTLIAQWQPGVRFVDVQLRGPYLYWRHRHDFERKDEGVVVRDTIDYALPFAPLGALAGPLVRADVRQIFDYRRLQMSRLIR
jgi:uncharacterized protein